MTLSKVLTASPMSPGIAVSLNVMMITPTGNSPVTTGCLAGLKSGTGDALGGSAFFSAPWTGNERQASAITNWRILFIMILPETARFTKSTRASSASGGTPEARI